MLDVSLELLCVTLLLLSVKSEHSWYFFRFHWLSHAFGIIRGYWFRNVYVDSADSKCFFALEHVGIFKLELSHQGVVLE